MQDFLFRHSDSWNRVWLEDILRSGLRGRRMLQRDRREIQIWEKWRRKLWWSSNQILKYFAGLFLFQKEGKLIERIIHLQELNQNKKILENCFALNILHHLSAHILFREYRGRLN